MDYSGVKRDRLIGIDVMRIMSAFVVFLFHSQSKIGCDYGILNSFVSKGAIFMTFFFMISGFSLYYVYSGIMEFTYTNGVIWFYKRRFSKIILPYWIVCLSWIIWDRFVNLNVDDICINIIILPIQLLGIQSVFHSLFSFSCIGGTWFISCILICYILFPYLIHWMDYFLVTKKRVIFSIIIIYLLMIYSEWITWYMEIEDTYSNTYFRLLEFVLGMIVFKIWVSLSEEYTYKKTQKGLACIICVVLLIFAITFCVNKNIIYGSYMMYNVVAVPFFIIILLLGAGIKFKRNKPISIINYLSDISYAYYFAQFYTWKIVLYLVKRITPENNILRIIIGNVVVLAIAVLMHVIQKPLYRRADSGI